MRLMILFTVFLALSLLSCGDSPSKAQKPDSARKPPSVMKNTIIVRGFKSAHLKFPHTLIISIPADYSNSEARYPVLYAHDGQNLFDPRTAFGGNEWKLDENIEDLQKAGVLGGLIVVGIYNNAMRVDEYTPTRISNQYVNNQGGMLSNYARFIVSELKPWVDSNFRTLTGPSDTGLMGSSLGGLASLYIMGLYPDVFGRAACISPSFWWDDNRVVKDLDTMRFNSGSRIYIDGGWLEGADESSMVPYMRGVYAKLLKKGLKHQTNIWYYEDIAGQHNEASWARRGKAPLRYLFGNTDYGIPAVRAVFYPQKIRVDGIYSLAAEFNYGQGLMETRPGFPFKVADSSLAAVLSNGTVIKGLAPGTNSLIFNAGGQAVTQAFVIRP